MATLKQTVMWMPLFTQKTRSSLEAHVINPRDLFLAIRHGAQCYLYLCQNSVISFFHSKKGIARAQALLACTRFSELMVHLDETKRKGRNFPGSLNTLILRCCVDFNIRNMHSLLVVAQYMGNMHPQAEFKSSPLVGEIFVKTKCIAN
jgi:hypothetical protein